jgi:hypothetical protein
MSLCDKRRAVANRFGHFSAPSCLRHRRNPDSAPGRRECHGRRARAAFRPRKKHTSDGASSRARLIVLGLEPCVAVEARHPDLEDTVCTRRALTPVLLGQREDVDGTLADRQRMRAMRWWLPFVFDLRAQRFESHRYYSTQEVVGQPLGSWIKSLLAPPTPHAASRATALYP